MTKVLTKQIQNKMSSYFSKLSNFLTRPESRCVREMVTGIIKNGSVLVNRIASEINDEVSLNRTCKRLRNHYNKPNFFMKLFNGHLESVKGKIHHHDYVLVDGSDIQKKYAKMMDGLDYVKDGDKSSVGLGYWLMNIIHFGKDGEITPLFNKLYSFDAGAKSENLEVIEAVKTVKEKIPKKLKYIFDRGMDRELIRNYIISGNDDFVLRLKKTTKLYYNGQEMKVTEIASKISLETQISAVKIKKNKKCKKDYSSGATKVQYHIGKNIFDLWLVVTKNRNGGLCFLLTRTTQEKTIEIIKETFKAYGHRWKIEEYHRHIKQCYKLEEIQIKTFAGLQSMLAILTVAMSIVYRELASMHVKLILESGVKTMNKEQISELYNFVYYKISKILKKILAHVKPNAFLPDIKKCSEHGQLRLLF